MTESPPLTRTAKAGSILRELPRTMDLVWESGRFTAVGLSVTLLLSALPPAAMAWVGKLIVDAVVAAAHLHASASSPEMRRVMELVLVEFGLVAIQTALARLSGYLREILRETLGNHVNVVILEKSTRLELRHFEDAEIYDKLQRARREASSRPFSLVLGLLSLGQQTVLLVIDAVLLARLSPWAVLIIVLASAPAFLAEARFSRESFRLNSWRAPETRQQGYLEWILTRDAQVKEVKIYGLAGLFVARYRAFFDKFFAEDRALARKRAVYGLGLGAIALLPFYASYLVMARRAAAALISLGDLTLYLTVFRQGQGAFQSVLGSLGDLYEDSLFMRNLFEFLDLETLAEAPRVAGPERSGEAVAPLRARAVPREIVIQNLSFRYRGQKDWVLRGVNLTIPAGEKLALCGDNGSGKSTLVKLLLKLYEPTEGEILYGGVDLRDLDADELRARVSVVFQDYVRYQFSVAENIGLGDQAALDDRPRIEVAAAQAGASGSRGFIDELPSGFDTRLGGWFEKGHELSAGQWQKLAIARAFMRDSELLVLDEPSASLDAEAEADLFARLRALADRRSAILISHRFSTLRMADEIALLRHGRIEELGSHEELIKLGGRYAELFALQAAGYRG